MIIIRVQFLYNRRCIIRFVIAKNNSSEIMTYKLDRLTDYSKESIVEELKRIARELKKDTLRMQDVE